MCLTVLVEFYTEISSKLDHIESEEREKHPSVLMLRVSTVQRSFEVKPFIFYCQQGSYL